MYVEFIKPPAGLTDLICEAELVFDEGDGPLAGLRLVGLSLWHHPADGGIAVVFPYQAVTLDGERHSFPFLQGARPDEDRLRRFVAEEYERSRETDAGVGLLDRVLVKRMARLYSAHPRDRSRPACMRDAGARHSAWTCRTCRRRQCQSGPRCRHCGAPRRAHGR